MPVIIVSELGATQLDDLVGKVMSDSVDVVRDLLWIMMRFVFWFGLSVCWNMVRTHREYTAY